MTEKTVAAPAAAALIGKRLHRFRTDDGAGPVWAVNAAAAAEALTAPEGQKGWTPTVRRDTEWDAFIAETVAGRRGSRWLGTVHQKPGGTEDETLLVVTCQRHRDGQHLDGQPVTVGGQYVLAGRYDRQPVTQTAAQGGTATWGIAEGGPDEVMCSGEHILIPIDGTVDITG